MNEMIDRVAKAISCHQPYCWRFKENNYEVWKRDEEGNLGELIKNYFTRDLAYEKVIELNNEVVARAAIEAMKEPTEKMIEAGVVTNDMDFGVSKDCYQAMIQAALDDV